MVAPVFHPSVHQLGSGTAMHCNNILNLQTPPISLCIPSFLAIAMAHSELMLSNGGATADRKKTKHGI